MRRGQVTDRLAWLAFRVAARAKKSRQLIMRKWDTNEWHLQLRREAESLEIKKMVINRMTLFSGRNRAIVKSSIKRNATPVIIRLPNRMLQIGSPIWANLKEQIGEWRYIRIVGI